MAEDTNKNYIGNYTSTSGAHTGYSTNQFLNINGPNGYESTSLDRTAQDNPEFLYPRNPAPNIYDSPNNVVTSTKVQRGFIRGIFPEVISDIQKEYKNSYTNAKPPVRRCFFQFNPSLILRSVQASSSTLNPLLQSATEIIQPIPGQASFEFQLLFNREREVSNQQYKNASGKTVGTSNLSSPLGGYGGVDAPYNQGDVGDIGVFADLYVLDSIIGQSITQDMVDTVKAYWDATKGSRGTKTSYTTVDKDGKTVKVEEEDNPWANTDFLGEKDTDFNQRLSQVLGNTAFLNPMPVRIVFSSLFMVEGFVTASNVAFHKFSANMVPTVCTVTLNVQALYIGFAKKQSYLSEQITQQIKDNIDAKAEAEQAVKDAQEAMEKHLHARLSWINSSRPLDGYSLNAWFLNRWSTYKETINYYLIGGSETDTQKDNAFSVWADPVLAPFFDKVITDITIDKAQLLILDKDNLPTKYNTPDKIIKAAKTGEFANSLKTGYDWKSLNPTKPTLPDYVLAELTLKTPNKDSIDISFDKLKKANFRDTANSEWMSTDIPLYDAKGTRTTSEYFKTHNYFVFIVTFAYSWTDADGNVQGPAKIIKACVKSFDPNSFPDFTDYHYLIPGNKLPKKYLEV